MAKKQTEAKNFQYKILHTIANFPSEKGGGGVRLCVAQWLIDGKETQPVVEKREYFSTETGGEKTGKAKGFSAMDYQRIVENIYTVASFLKVPRKEVDLWITTAQGTGPVEQPAAAEPVEAASHGSDPWA